MVVWGHRGSFWAKNGAKHPISKNSSDIDATRRRRHGQSCFTFVSIRFFSQVIAENKNGQILSDGP